MGAPQIIWFCLVALSFGFTLSKHGQPRTDKHSAWSSLLGIGISAGLLYWGGFFNG